MKSDTLANFIQCLIALSLGIFAFVAALFFGATWHLISAAMCFVLAWVLYTDDAYGIVSVRQWFKNRYKKN